MFTPYTYTRQTYKFTLMKARTLLAKIVAKGGVIGKCGAFYIDSENLSAQYIYELKAQIKNESTQRLWGKGLVQEIADFKMEAMLLVTNKEPVFRRNLSKTRIEFPEGSVKTSLLSKRKVSM